MEFVEFYDRWTNRYLAREAVPFCAEETELMNGDFIASVARHRLGIPAYDAPWGWKEPRSHFLLPFLHAKYSRIKLIHVIRDGRDMAFSDNQNQLRKHGAAVLGPALRNLTGLYLLVTFEQLCAKPRETANSIASFLGSTGADLDCCTAEIVAPPSIGRWKKVKDPELIHAVLSQAEPALRRFGYDSAEVSPAG